MRELFFAAFLSLLIFSGQAMAYVVGDFDLGPPNQGTVSFMQQGQWGELYLHTGEIFIPDDPSFDYNVAHQFRYDWRTVSYESSLGVMNSGSVFWFGTLQNFLDQTYSPTLVIDGTPITLTGFYGENGDGHVFQGDIDGQIQVNPVELGVSQVSLVPIPGAVWLLASGLVGLVGLRRRFQN